MPILLTSQKASLYLVLDQAKGFNSVDFDYNPKAPAPAWQDEGGEEVRLRGTGYHFTIYRNHSERFGAGDYEVVFSPGSNTLSERNECTDWPAVCKAFSRYLTFLLRETTTINPWETAKQFSKDVRALPHLTDSNAPITGAEKNEIRRALHDIHTTLSAQAGDSSEKHRYIEEQFRLLEDSITHFGRKDYLMLLYTTVIGMATAIGVSPDVGKRIIGILNTLLTHIPKLLA